MMSSIKENGNVLQSANTKIRLKTLSNTLSLHSDDLFRPNNLKDNPNMDTSNFLHNKHYQQPRKRLTPVAKIKLPTAKI